jgi:hypothetical protein
MRTEMAELIRNDWRTSEKTCLLKEKETTPSFSHKGGHISRLTLSTITVQTTPESQPSSPTWMGDVAACAQILSQTGILTAITDQVRFARARMGTDERIDCVVVLIGDALSGEPPLQAFSERLGPCAGAFMALFERQHVPSRAALSRFLAVLDQCSVEKLRTLFQHDLLARQPCADPGGITDRCGHGWLVADVDGTRKVARQRALPHTESLPAPQRRCDRVCANGHQGRTRGDVVRTRTIVLHAHTHQLLGTVGGAGNGDDRGELLRALAILLQDATQVKIPPERILVRLDGLSGTAAPLCDVLAARLGVRARHTDDHLLDRPAVHAILAGPPAATCPHPESQMTRALCDCPDIPLSPAGPQVRVLVATSPVTADAPSVGEQRAEMVDERFVSTVPAPAFSANDVLDLSLHRGSCETVLSDEDDEHDADRWVSRPPFGQDCFQILAQWLWNLRPTGCAPREPQGMGWCEHLTQEKREKEENRETFR